MCTFHASVKQLGESVNINDILSPFYSPSLVTPWAVVKRYIIKL